MVVAVGTTLTSRMIDDGIVARVVCRVVLLHAACHRVPTVATNAAQPGERLYVKTIIPPWPEAVVVKDLSS